MHIPCSLASQPKHTFRFAAGPPWPVIPSFSKEGYQEVRLDFISQDISRRLPAAKYSPARGTEEPSSRYSKQSEKARRGWVMVLLPLDLCGDDLIFASLGRRIQTGRGSPAYKHS